MKKALLDEYVCPIDQSGLTLRTDSNGNGAELKDGTLLSSAGTPYTIADGVPHFIAPEQLSTVEQETKQQYEEYYTEEFYNNVMGWLFESFYEDEDSVRNSMVDVLELKPSARVLEVGCGTGCDSFRIASRLESKGELFLQDLSGAMVAITKRKLAEHHDKLSCKLNFFVSSARHLPFPDNYFDALFHFGGFNNFEDPKGTLLEFSRIVKEGGKIVVGDESVPPWLEGTEFGELVCTNNPLFRSRVPLSSVPESARNVTVRWILGNCFYLIDFTVGSGPPALNLDLPHKGRRGGTMRSRYYGQLEGVTTEAKKLAQLAAEKNGISLHSWLDKTVLDAARIVLDRNEN